MKRKIVKEGYYKGELLSSALSDAEKAMSLLVQASNKVRDALGEESHLFERLDSHANDIDDTIDNLKYTINGMDKDEYATPISESNVETYGETRWSESGELLTTLPMDCIKSCAHSGRCDDDVEFWVEELGFADGMPIDQAIEYIAEYGAWDREELAEKNPEEIAQIVLWLFCGNIKDEAYMFMRDEDTEGWPDIEDWDDNDWRRFQTEQCYVGLNH